MFASTRRWPALLVLSMALSTSAAGQAPDSAFFAAMTARSVGPTGMSGRIAAIDGVHADPNVIYVGAATGGLWKSTSGGMTWTPLMDDYPASSIGAIERSSAESRSVAAVIFSKEV